MEKEFLYYKESLKSLSAKNIQTYFATLKQKNISMKTLKYKALTFGNHFVDESKLFSGICITMTPTLRSEYETLESLISEAVKIKNNFLVKEINQYIENLKQCELKDVTLYL